MLGIWVMARVLRSACYGLRGARRAHPRIHRVARAFKTKYAIVDI